MKHCVGSLFQRQKPHSGAVDEKDSCFVFECQSDSVIINQLDGMLLIFMRNVENNKENVQTFQPV